MSRADDAMSGYAALTRPTGLLPKTKLGIAQTHTIATKERR